MKVRELLVKKPFVRAIPPLERLQPRMTDSLKMVPPIPERKLWEVITQFNFETEYDPNGHKINSEEYYPDKVKYDEKTESYFKEKVFRVSIPFQRIILAQQLVHLCGNDIHHELTGNHNNEVEKELFFELKRGWLDKNMETAFYELARSVKRTGDGAIVFFIDNGRLNYKVLSYVNGDMLFPHYDAVGNLSTFVRTYNDYDEDGETTTTYAEVYDKTYVTLFKRDEMGVTGLVSKVSELFGLDGFRRVGEPVRHNFNEIPIAYMRDDDGACWSSVQSLIDKYELAVSHLCQNNMAYAFPIMLLKGDDLEVQGDIYGAVKSISMGNEDNVSYLEQANNSSAFELQLNVLLKNIFNGSFTVQAPEVKSGDLPGVAIKLIYSPSIDKAMVDAKEYDSVLDKMVRLFKWGYGFEIGKATQLANLGTYSWIEPYIHQNQAELVNNLVQLVNAGLLSHNTGCALTGYGENDEFDKTMQEYKQQQAADLLFDLENTNPTDNGNNPTGGGDEETVAPEMGN